MRFNRAFQYTVIGGKSPKRPWHKCMKKNTVLGFCKVRLDT